MKRREFIKLSTVLGVGTPLVLNGLPARAFSFMAPPIVNCADINDRIMVVVRLAGANDGLNTVIPLAQYSQYSTLRPTLKLANTGANAIIGVDATTALHPAMTGFSNLIQAGKLAIFPGSGYPAPNYSHFASENTLFAGKDGNTNDAITSGLFGRFLEKMLPGFAGNPNTIIKDPLAIHMGTTNPSLFYNNPLNTNIEYNITSFQSSLFSQLFQATVPPASDYEALLSHIETLESAMDVYYDTVISRFNAGNNSTTTYPNTNLGKQLKTVARMIKGGSKTKVFQVTLGGFDTHVNQVISGATHTGAHATLLTDVSNSIAAFQTDLEVLGLADKVVTLTFSEFGRQVRENASTGTDHGNISPLFVVGTHVTAGVYGGHPSLAVPAASTTAFQYPEAERKWDYRQVYATLLQDWMGADNSVITATELDAGSIGATAATKVPNLINASQNAAPGCLTSGYVNTLFPTEEIVCESVATVGGWTYYAPAGYTGNGYFFGVEHLPAGTGANTAAFTMKVVFRKIISSPTGKRAWRSTAILEGTFVAGYYWTIGLLSGVPNGSVNMRFFQNADILLETASDATAFKNSNAASYQSSRLWFRTRRPLKMPADVLPAGLACPVFPLGSFTASALNGYDYQQWDGQTDFGNTSGGCLIKVTNQNDTNTTAIPGNMDAQGLIRLNSESGTFEGYDGTDWRPLRKF